MYDGNIDQLTELSRADRVTFMHDLVLLGQAVERACRAADPGSRAEASTGPSNVLTR